MALKHNDDDGILPSEPSSSNPDIDPEVEAAYAEYRKLPPEIICPWNPSLTREMIDAMIAQGDWMTTAEVRKLVGMP